MKFICKLGKFILPILMVLTLLIMACGPSTPAQIISAAVLPMGDLFKVVPGSEFLMGSERGEPMAREDEFPQHTVILPTFFIMRREVTNMEYQKCVEAGVCSDPLVKEEGPTSLYPDPAFGTWPLLGADWFQAMQYCEFIHSRLPTEAEWEKAARGRQSLTWPHGDDEPTCDLLNMAGCLDELDTQEVEKYPDGESQYKLLDMAGNVREWTADWFDPRYYEESALYNPLGPEQGKLKVTRGGSWNDSVEDARGAARIPMDPKEQSELVGFRCVFVPPDTFAPVCPPSFRTFCDPGRYIDGGEPCIPEEQNDCGEYAISGIDCPVNGVHTIRFTVPGGDAGQYNVTIGADGFTCTGNEGTITCTGPEQDMGEDVTITVCGPPPTRVQFAGTEGEPQSTTASLSSILLVNYTSPLLSLSPAQSAIDVASYCPEGYHIDEDSSECVKDEGRKPCPDGWHYEQIFDEESGHDVLICVLDEAIGCPPGTTYQADPKGCIPTDPELGCPYGYILTDEETCIPDFIQLFMCMLGWWFDDELGCCEPFENPCVDTTTYFDTRVEDCLPQNPGGCPRCTYFDTLYGCIPIPDCDPGGQEGGDDQTNGVAFAANLDCFPNDVGPDGECNPPPGGECGEDYVPITDPVSGEIICVPFYGPGSDCPPGYATDPRTFCCVPLRDPCIDLEATTRLAGYTSGEENQQPPEITGFSGFMTVDENFNPYGGDCEEQDGQDGEDGCPPGTVPSEYGCTDEQGGGTAPNCPEGCIPGTQDYWNCYCPPGIASNCPTDDECWELDETQNICRFLCGDGQQNGSSFSPCNQYEQVWIPELQLCFPLGDDCCASGYDWSAYFGECVPIVQNFGQMPAGTACADGYELVDGLCLLIGRRNPEECCWTTTVNFPLCIGGCEVGYTMVGGRCVKPDPCATATCGYTTEPECNNDKCCIWDPNQRFCHKK